MSSSGQDDDKGPEPPYNWLKKHVVEAAQSRGVSETSLISRHMQMRSIAPLATYSNDDIADSLKKHAFRLEPSALDLKEEWLPSSWQRIWICAQEAKPPTAQQKKSNQNPTNDGHVQNSGVTNRSEPQRAGNKMASETTNRKGGKQISSMAQKNDEPKTSQKVSQTHNGPSSATPLKETAQPRTGSKDTPTNQISSKPDVKANDDKQNIGRESKPPQKSAPQSAHPAIQKSDEPAKASKEKNVTNPSHLGEKQPLPESHSAAERHETFLPDLKNTPELSETVGQGKGVVGDTEALEEKAAGFKEEKPLLTIEQFKNRREEPKTMSSLTLPWEWNIVDLEERIGRDQISFGSTNEMSFPAESGARQKLFRRVARHTIDHEGYIFGCIQPVSQANVSEPEITSEYEQSTNQVQPTVGDVTAEVGIQEEDREETAHEIDALNPPALQARHHSDDVPSKLNTDETSPCVNNGYGTGTEDIGLAPGRGLRPTTPNEEQHGTAPPVLYVDQEKRLADLSQGVCSDHQDGWASQGFNPAPNQIVSESEAFFASVDNGVNYATGQLHDNATLQQCAPQQIYAAGPGQRLNPNATPYAQQWPPYQPELADMRDNWMEQRNMATQGRWRNARSYPIDWPCHWHVIDKQHLMDYYENIGVRFIKWSPTSKLDVYRRVAIDYLTGNETYPF